jgi:lipocalin
MMPYLLIACLLLAGCAGVAAPPRQTVPAVSLDRYLGTWYEIARFDHRFERGLSAVTATYTLRPDGRIDVLNAGTTAAGKRKTAHGVARIPRAEEPGRLQVTFFLWFWPTTSSSTWPPTTVTRWWAAAQRLPVGALPHAADGPRRLHPPAAPGHGAGLRHR